MWRPQPLAQPHPVRNTFDHSTRTCALAVELKRMNQLVHQDALDLMSYPRAVSLDAVDVRDREVDLLVLVVQLAPARVRHPVKLAQVERD